jgi:hypothetical protein
MRLRKDQQVNLEWAAAQYAKAIRQRDWAAVRDYQDYGKRIAGQKVWRGMVAR